jgi:hypothetical protein
MVFKHLLGRVCCNMMEVLVTIIATACPACIPLTHWAAMLTVVCWTVLNGDQYLPGCCLPGLRTIDMVNARPLGYCNAAVAI